MCSYIISNRRHTFMYNYSIDYQEFKVVASINDLVLSAHLYFFEHISYSM